MKISFSFLSRLARLGASALLVLSGVALFAQDRFIVTVHPGPDAAAVARTHRVAADRQFGVVLNGLAGPLTPAQIRNLQRDARVASVVPDHPVSVLGKPTGGGGGTTVSEKLICPEPFLN